jgi:diguanylate cyclase (GGDEF)-like protein
MFIDLDDFKAINDTRGHAAGDTVLAAVGRRIAGCLRPGDVVARLGGDEFAVLVTDVPPAGPAAEIATRILAALCAPVASGDGPIAVSATIGLAEAGPDDLGGANGASELLRNADIAMYAAKTSGKGRLEVFQPELHEGAVRRLSLRGELERAVGHNELVLHYQPIVELASGHVAGVEALVRWDHPERGLLSPAQFIPMAEEAGLIALVDRWVLQTACHDAAAKGLQVSVNLSTHQVHAGTSLVEDVGAAIVASGLEPGSLTLELTESAFLADLEVAATILGELKALGVRLAIDDFGTGFSSLSYLARLPIDVLKIDRSFVQVPEDDVAQIGLVRTIVGLGPTLGIETVAEGIERPEQLAAMRAVGCLYGQGYLLSPPVDSATLDDLLDRGGPIHGRPAPAPRPTGVQPSTSHRRRPALADLTAMPAASQAAGG